MFFVTPTPWIITTNSSPLVDCYCSVFGTCKVPQLHIEADVDALVLAIAKATLKLTHEMIVM